MGGKAFCMLYALVGIPINLVMFQSVGERLNSATTFTLKTAKKCLKLRNTEVTQTHLIIICVSISTLFLTIGALVFSKYENWAYFDSLYYCFITLTTIGFGELVALQQENALEEQWEYVVFSLFFILFGLTVISAGMNLLVLRFLTMNTEDERRAELEAMEAARTAVRLEGKAICDPQLCPHPPMEILFLFNNIDSHFIFLFTHRSSKC